jgi:hypothetical protein
MNAADMYLAHAERLTPARVSVSVIFLLVLGAIAYDIFAAIFFGNSATLSWIILGVEAGYHVFAFILPYACGVLMRHLLIPVDLPEPPVLLTLAKLAIVAAPVALGLFLVWLAPAATQSGLTWLLAHATWLSVALVGSFGIGVLAGALVPQHLG